MSNQIKIRIYTNKDLLEKRNELVALDDPDSYITKILSDYGTLLKNNPNYSKNDICLSLALDGKTIIGRLEFISSKMHLDSKVFPILWLSGFYLNDKYKNTGAGAMLLMSGLSGKMPLFASGWPSKDCQELYRATGFHEYTLKRYFLFYDIKKIIQYKLGKNIFSSVLTILSKIIYNPFLNIFLKLNNYKLLNYKQVSSFSKNLDYIEQKKDFSYFPVNSPLLNWSIDINQENRFPFELYDGISLIGCLLINIKIIKNENSNNPNIKIGSLLHYSLDKKYCTTKYKYDILVFCLKFLIKKEVDAFEVQSFDSDIFQGCKKLLMIKNGGNKIFIKTNKTCKEVLSRKIKFTKSAGDVLIC